MGPSTYQLVQDFFHQQYLLRFGVQCILFLASPCYPKEPYLKGDKQFSGDLNNFQGTFAVQNFCFFFRRVFWMDMRWHALSRLLLLLLWWWWWLFLLLLYHFSSHPVYRLQRQRAAWSTASWIQKFMQSPSRRCGRPHWCKSHVQTVTKRIGFLQWICRGQLVVVFQPRSLHSLNEDLCPIENPLSNIILVFRGVHFVREPSKEPCEIIENHRDHDLGASN